MPKPEEMNKLLSLTVLLPDRPPVELPCGSVRLTAADGGQYGIRPGHAPAMIALAPGELTASRDGTVLCRLLLGGGFARVAGNTVTVVTESCGDLFSPAGAER